MSLSDTRIAIRLSPLHHNLTFHWSEKAFYVTHDVHKATGGAASPAASLLFNHRVSLLGPKQPRIHEVAHHDLLRVSFERDSRTLSVAYLKPKTKKKKAILVVLSGIVEETPSEDVDKWAEAIMKSLYEGNTLFYFL